MYMLRFREFEHTGFVACIWEDPRDLRRIFACPRMRLLVHDLPEVSSCMILKTRGNGFEDIYKPLSISDGAIERMTTNDASINAAAMKVTIKMLPLPAGNLPSIT